MTTVELCTHDIYPWCSGKDTCEVWIRGLFRYKGVYYEDGIPSELLKISSEADFKAVHSQLSGNYALICKVGELTFAAVDRIAVYPLFYSCSAQGALISDSFAIMERHQEHPCGDEESQMEFLASQMVIGNRTMIKNVYTIEAGQYLVIDEMGRAVLHDYDTHSHTESYPNDVAWLTEKHNEVVDDVFERMISTLHGRKVVLFLSGGYDSRLVAVQLHKHDYTNVLCVSFGKESDREASVAHKVADALGFEWILLNTDSHYVRTLIRTDVKMQAYQVHASNGLRVPYLESVLLRPYFESGKIPTDCVIVNGNSGDFIEGEQFYPQFVPDKEYSCDQLIDAILDKHFTLSGKIVSEFPAFRHEIYNLLHLSKDRMYSYDECQELFEQFNWRERQCKYVITSMYECEDLHHVDWRLPLWDDALVDFWLNVPIEQRAHRNLYYKIVGHENLPTANIITPYRKFINFSKEHLAPIISFLYPFKKLHDFLKPDSSYYSAGVSEYLSILSYTKGYRTNFISLYAYVLSQTIYKQYYGNTRQFVKKMMKQSRYSKGNRNDVVN